MNTPFQLEANDEIRYIVVQSLGGGAQGNVHEVVDMYSGKSKYVRELKENICSVRKRKA